VPISAGLVYMLESSLKHHVLMRKRPAGGRKESTLGVSHKRRPHRAKGIDKSGQMWTRGKATVDVHKLYHFLMIVCSCWTLSFQEMAQKWAKVTTCYCIRNLMLHSIVLKFIRFTFNTLKEWLS